jgi:hypothetical protein
LVGLAAVGGRRSLSGRVSAANDAFFGCFFTTFYMLLGTPDKEEPRIFLVEVSRARLDQATATYVRILFHPSICLDSPANLSLSIIIDLLSYVSLCHTSRSPL